jgi:sugar/nucleoside kinase (ribokinase family)
MALGNTIVDLLIEVDDNKLVEFNLKKGEFHLVDEDKSKDILKIIQDQQLSVQICPGGSAANTLRGLALLGGTAILCGKVGQDKHGEYYIQEVKKQGVNSKINTLPQTTGHAITFITPDAQRTFSVHLGAAIKLYKEDVIEEDIAKSKILHLEGYQVEGQTKETLLHSITLAKKNNTLVSIDLADPGVIRRNLDFLKELIKDADIVFLNETEAEAFTGTNNEVEAVKKLGEQVKIAIVKVGKDGSYIFHNNTLSKIPGFPANAIDTTGAGDTFAAGFLYGYCNGWDLDKSGRLGSLYASKIVEKIGVKLHELDVETIKSQVDN